MLVEPHFEIFDHTADAGIRVRAATLPELIEPATRGLYAVIGELVAKGNSEDLEFDGSGDDPAVLLRDFLQEALLLFETRHRIITSVDVPAFTPATLSVRGKTEAVDPERSVFYREVKAVTYHELAIHEIPGGHEAAVIVDI